jgi:hypothetical protein
MLVVVVVFVDSDALSLICWGRKSSFLNYLLLEVVLRTCWRMRTFMACVLFERSKSCKIHILVVLQFFELGRVCV